MLKNDFKSELDIASTGERALKLVKSNKYDLIFMDSGLPNTNGYIVTKKIRTGKKQKYFDSNCSFNRT
jgi:DNA-binding response OmpR family regulator